MESESKNVGLWFCMYNGQWTNCCMNEILASKLIQIWVNARDKIAFGNEQEQEEGRKFMKGIFTTHDDEGRIGSAVPWEYVIHLHTHPIGPTTQEKMVAIQERAIEVAEKMCDLGKKAELEEGEEWKNEFEEEEDNE